SPGHPVVPEENSAKEGTRRPVVGPTDFGGAYPGQRWKIQQHDRHEKGSFHSRCQHKQRPELVQTAALGGAARCLNSPSVCAPSYACAEGPADRPTDTQRLDTTLSTQARVPYRLRTETEK
ncbi:hypothetical protein JZ751_017919, partial [Albula glossodonta]